MGLSTAKAADMSTSMVGLAGDLASFKNISSDVAKTALTGIFTGETESLKSLGIVMTQANLQEFAYSQGIRTKVQEMTQAEQVQLRYNYVMANTTNAQGDFVRTQGGAANQMRIFTESMKELGATMGAQMLPYVTAIITKINEWVQQFAQLDAKTQKIILVVAGVAAAIGPVLLVLGALSSSFSAIIAIAPAVGTAFTIMTGPIGLIVLGIAALIAIGVLLYKNWDTIKVKATELWGKIGEVWDNIKKKTSDVWNGILDFFKKWYPLLLTIALGPLGLLVSYIIGHWTEIKTKTADIWNGIKIFFATWWKTFTAWISSWEIWSYVAGAWTSFKTNVLNVFVGLASDALAWGKNIVQGLINGISGAISRAVETAKSLASGVNNAIKSMLGINSPSTVMIEFGKMVSEGLAVGIEEKSERVKTAAESLVEVIKDVSSAMVDKLGTAMDIVSKEFKIMDLRLAATTSNSEKLQEAKNVLARELGLTADEVEDLTAAYGNDLDALYDLGLESKSTALKKQELARQMSAAQEKANVLTEAYARMVEVQGENSDAAMDLKSQLLDVQIAAAEYANDLVSANEAVAESAKSVYEEYANMSEEVGKGSKSSNSSSSSASGWKYTDKYGIDHVVSSKATAEKYGQEGTIKKYEGKSAGGYALAGGAVINTPTKALLGETFEARPEIISPVKLMASTFADVLKSFASQQGMGALITGNNFYVRNDNDIKLIAQELFTLQRQAARGQGVLA